MKACHSKNKACSTAWLSSWQGQHLGHLASSSAALHLAQWSPWPCSRGCSASFQTCAQTPPNSHPPLLQCQPPKRRYAKHLAPSANPCFVVVPRHLDQQLFVHFSHFFPGFTLLTKPKRKIFKLPLICLPAFNLCSEVYNTWVKSSSSGWQLALQISQAPAATLQMVPSARTLPKSFPASFLASCRSL